MSKAVVLLSGGLDSATCLALAKQSYTHCYALSLEYGQRHGAELAAAKRVADAFEVEAHRLVSVSLNEIGGSALTDPTIDVPDYSDKDDIPITYVPARNTVFLSIAMGWAEALGADAVYIGVSQVDYSGYPDCRPAFIDAFQSLANVATRCGVEGNPIQIMAPLMRLSKAETIQKGLTLGVDYGLTISCYQANEKGEACGRCDSCILRRQGFEQAGVADPTRYRDHIFRT